MKPLKPSTATERYCRKGLSKLRSTAAPVGLWTIGQYGARLDGVHVFYGRRANYFSSSAGLQNNYEPQVGGVLA